MMRLRTTPIRGTTPRDVVLDGVKLGGVMGNSLVLPFLWMTYLLMGMTVLGVVFFGAWVFVLTLWGREYRFAFYFAPREVDDDEDERLP